MTIQASPPAEKSTIVRSSGLPSVPRTVRAAFRGLELLAPAVGARWAYLVWFTVPRNGGSIRLPGEPGHPFVVTVRGRRVVGRHWGTGARAIYLMHGWGGRWTQLSAFVQPLVAAGFSVVTFDGPSHGDSDPGSWGARRSSIPEQAEALSAVVARHGEPYAVIAHSGGCAAVGYALRDGLPADRLVFVAPLAHPLDYSYQLAATLGFGERTRTRLVRRIEQTFGVPSAYFDIPPVAASVETPPALLLLHDQDDAHTSPAESEAIRRAWPASRLVTTHGLGHYRILRDPDVVARAVSFVAE